MRVKPKLKRVLRTALVAWKGSPNRLDIPRVQPGTAIPRIIHQTWDRPGAQALPQSLAANVERIRCLNPTWEHRLYGDDAMWHFIKQEYGDTILGYYERINPSYGAARADFFRYLLMYRIGGVYLDIKSCVARPLDEILKPEDRLLLGYWNNAPGQEHAGFGMHEELGPRGELQQWHIIAAPGHPCLRAVLMRVMRNIRRYDPVLHGTGRNGVLRVTGPIAYTEAVLSALDAQPHRFIDASAEGFQYIKLTPEQRQAAFGTHYSELRQPVVTLTVTGRAFSTLLRLPLAMVARGEPR
jgi:inositol phosphorylceramide mannosyltransferase catalytic subunit